MPLRRKKDKGVFRESEYVITLVLHSFFLFQFQNLTLELFCAQKKRLFFFDLFFLSIFSTKSDKSLFYDDVFFFDDFFVVVVL